MLYKWKMCSLYMLLMVVVTTQSGYGATRYDSTDVPKDIPDNGTTNSVLEIADSGPIGDIDVVVDISHSWAADLEAFLISPDGTRIELFTNVGGGGENFSETVLDNEAPLSITKGQAPFTGSYQPEGSLSDFYGMNITGTWILEISDIATGDFGDLNSWSLIIEQAQDCLLDPPVIRSEPNVPGGICDIVYWDDVGQVRQYESIVAEDILDEQTITSALVVDDLGIIEDVNVMVNITHSWDEDLDVYLIAPDGTRIELFTDVGDSGDDFSNTILDDEASLLITNESAPFIGSYRPEGNLGDLIGKDILGTWALEITDDSWLLSGTLNSWSLIADLADVLYYAECATDPDFNNVVAHSNWMMANGCRFIGLNPNQEYWYRVKARPLQTWPQTNQSDFGINTLIDTQSTSDGDVMLADRDSATLFDVIENPSFELEGGWSEFSSTPWIALGIYPDDIWASEGSWTGGAILSEDFSYSEDDYCYLWQTVDWTGVGTLVFDCANVLGNDLTASVLIGDTQVWSSTGAVSLIDVHYDQTVDVSGFSGQQKLKLKVEVDQEGSFAAGVFWDNLRTYAPSHHALLGSMISAPINLAADDTWDKIVFGATTPEGTELSVDILPATGSTPIRGYENILSGTDLSDLNERTIRLRATLSTSDSITTPVLHEWYVTYTSVACESEWSNVASSQNSQDQLPAENSSNHESNADSKYTYLVAE